jgi:hypothetical protein
MQFPHRSSLFRPDNLVLQSLSSKTLLNSPCIVDLAPMLLFLYCLLALMLKTRLSPLIPFFPPFHCFFLDPHFSPSWLYFNSSLNNYGMWLITPTLLQIFNDRALPHLREDKRLTQRINIRKRIWELNSWIKPPFSLDPSSLVDYSTPIFVHVPFTADITVYLLKTITQCLHIIFLAHDHINQHNLFIPKHIGSST